MLKKTFLKLSYSAPHKPREEGSKLKQKNDECGGKNETFIGSLSSGGLLSFFFDPWKSLRSIFITIQLELDNVGTERDRAGCALLGIKGFGRSREDYGIMDIPFL